MKINQTLFFTLNQDINKELKEDLDNLYQTWQEQINNRDVAIDEIFLAHCRKKLLEKKLSKHIFKLWKS